MKLPRGYTIQKNGYGKYRWKFVLPLGKGLGHSPYPDIKSGKECKSKRAAIRSARIIHKHFTEMFESSNPELFFTI